MRLLSSAVLSQAVVSAGNLLVGLLLIRRQSDAQYGYYVLVTATLLLLTGLQVGFIQPPMVVRLARFDELARRELIGGLIREQRRVLLLAGGLAALLTCALWGGALIDGSLATLLLAGVIAAAATLSREFFRMVLMAYRQPIEVLLSDLAYVVFLVGGAFLATLSPLPAATAVLTLSLAGAVGGTMLARALWRHEPWKIDGARGIFREIAPTGSWSVSGAGIHWAFNQGYTYLVAGLLDVQAVAAIAATRLLLMPVNLLSTGMFQIVLPTASKWLHQHGAARLFRRLLLLCAGLSALAVCYFGLMWNLRDWIFGHVFKKQFAHRDALLVLWSLIFLGMLLRDQLAPLLVARERLAQMTILVALSATLALAVSYLAIGQIGAPGALAGVLTGEMVNVLGIAILSGMEIGRPTLGPALRPVAAPADGGVAAKPDSPRPSPGGIRADAVPLVSVLIPAHNAQEWISASIESALNQTWPNVELIVVDDGSTDGTLSIARRYERENVKVLTQSNRGAAAARNRALQEASGDVIQFLDADDLLAPDKIARQVPLLEEDVLCSGEWGSFFSDPGKARFLASALDHELAPVDWLVTAWTRGLMMQPGAWLLSRKLAERAGAWDERLSLNDDGEYFARVILASRAVRFCPGARVFYRVGNTGSLSWSYSRKSTRSNYLSILLSTGYLLNAEDSQRTRRAAAESWMAFVYASYPLCGDLIADAEGRIRELGFSGLLRPRGGLVFHAVSQIIGWKVAKFLRTPYYRAKIGIARTIE